MLTQFQSRNNIHTSTTQTEIQNVFIKRKVSIQFYGQTSL
jgi:hypothetical protein